MEIGSNTRRQNHHRNQMSSQSEKDEKGLPVKNRSIIASQGYNKKRLEYAETFAPIARLEAIRLLCVLLNIER